MIRSFCNSGAPVLRSVRTRTRWTGLAAGAIFGLTFAAAIAQVSQGLRIRGIRYPNYDAAGSLQSVIEGESAVILTNDDVNVSGLTMQVLGTSGRVTTVQTTNCVYKPAVGKASSDSPVRMEYAGTVVNGKGLVWRKDDDRVEIMRDVAVSVSNAAEWTRGPTAGVGTGAVAIVSERMIFRPSEEKGIFIGNVHVDRTGMTITSDELAVFLGQGRVLSTATATGNVTIVEPNSTGTCAKASIDSDAGTITLSGKACILRAGEEVGGEKIAILQSRDRIEAESGYMRFNGIRPLKTEKTR